MVCQNFLYQAPVVGDLGVPPIVGQFYLPVVDWGTPSPFHCQFFTSMATH